MPDAPGVYPGRGAAARADPRRCARLSTPLRSPIMDRRYPPRLPDGSSRAVAPSRARRNAGRTRHLFRTGRRCARRSTPLRSPIHAAALADHGSALPPRLPDGSSRAVAPSHARRNAGRTSRLPRTGRRCVCRSTPLRSPIHAAALADHGSALPVPSARPFQPTGGAEPRSAECRTHPAFIPDGAPLRAPTHAAALADPRRCARRSWIGATRPLRSGTPLAASLATPRGSAPCAT